MATEPNSGCGGSKPYVLFLGIRSQWDLWEIEVNTERGYCTGLKLQRENSASNINSCVIRI